MVVRLRECCAVLRPRRVVAVVGAGHVAGMVGFWDNTFTTDELEELRQSKVCADALYSKFSELFFQIFQRLFFLLGLGRPTGRPRALLGFTNSCYRRHAGPP